MGVESISQATWTMMGLPCSWEMLAARAGGAPSTEIRQTVLAEVKCVENNASNPSHLARSGRHACPSLSLSPQRLKHRRLPPGHHRRPLHHMPAVLTPPTKVCVECLPQLEGWAAGAMAQKLGGGVAVAVLRDAACGPVAASLA